MSLKSKRKRTEYARLFLYPLQNNFTVIDMCGAFFTIYVEILFVLNFFLVRFLFFKRTTLNR